MLSFQQKTDAVFIRATILPFVLKIDHFKHQNLENLVPPAACERVVSSVGLDTAVYPMCIKMPVDMHPESAAHRLEFRI